MATTSAEVLPDRPAPARLRFDSFELDPGSGELWRDGAPVRLQPQPLKVLSLLATRAGEVVGREELRREVWGEDTHVDFEQGLNFCIKQVRAALGDEAQAPRFIQTLPRRGYRFLVPVERVAGGAPGERVRDRPRRPGLAGALLTLAVLTLAAGAALVRWAGEPPAASVGRSALLVLPFDNLTGRPELEYVADGLTEELITDFARLAPDRLAVIARTSAMAYKGDPAPVSRLGRLLGVSHLIEGSVRESEGRIRITAQLIRTSDQTHEWAEVYDRPSEDVLTLQREVAGRILGAVALRLLPPGASLPTPAPSADPVAYEAYLEGRYAWHAGDFEKSRALFARALAVEPGLAVARAGLADAWLSLATTGARPPQESFPEAEAAARTALAVDPQQAEAWTVLGTVRLYYATDLEGARRAFERALAANPGLARTHHWFAGYFSALGRHEEALAEMRRARALDPLSRPVIEDVGWYAFFARRYPEALAAFRRALELEPGYLQARTQIVATLFALGRYDEGLDEARRARRAQGLPAADLQALARFHGTDGMRAYLRWSLDHAERQARSGPVPPSAVFLPAAELGKADLAFAWLERARKEHWPWLVAFVKVDPRLDGIRSDPRYRRLLREMGLPAD